MLTSITSLLVAISTGLLTEVTTSRVQSDLDIHIASRGVGDAIYIGPCSPSPSDRDVFYIRFVDAAVGADLVGYLVANEYQADHIFCTE